MTEQWRSVRDTIQSKISDTVGRVEATKQAGETVAEGFGLQVDHMGHTTSRHGSRLKLIAQQPSAPGLYLGVREAKLQEASRVFVDDEGNTTISYTQMPNFEPGHSPELGEHTPTTGVAYKVGRIVFLPDGETNSYYASIDSSGMVTEGGWNGEASTSRVVTDDARMQELEDWVQTVTSEII